MDLIATLKKIIAISIAMLAVGLLLY